MPAGGIVPNNLNKSKQSGGPSSQPNTSVKVAPKASSSTSGGSGTGGVPSSTSPDSKATTSPSSVQQSSPSPRRRVIITAPLSPPTTRASRSKETDSSKTPQRNSATSSSSPKKNKSTKPSDATKVKTSSHSTSAIQPKKEKVLPTPPPDVTEETPVESSKEKRKKSKKKKSKKSKSKRQHRVPSPPSPPITVEFMSTREDSNFEKGSDDEESNKEETVEQSSAVADIERDRLLALNFCDELDRRRPTLTLVIPQSPKKEEVEDPITQCTQLLPATPSPPPSVIEGGEAEATSPFLDDSYDDEAMQEFHQTLSPVIEEAEGRTTSPLQNDTYKEEDMQIFDQPLSPAIDGAEAVTTSPLEDMDNQELDQSPIFIIDGLETDTSSPLLNEIPEDNKEENELSLSVSESKHPEKISESQDDMDECNTEDVFQLAVPEITETEKISELQDAMLRENKEEDKCDSLSMERQTETTSSIQNVILEDNKDEDKCASSEVGLADVETTSAMQDEIEILDKTEEENKSLLPEIDDKNVTSPMQDEILGDREEGEKSPSFEVGDADITITSPLQDTRNGDNKRDEVECILPHDIDELDEADLMDTVTATTEASPSRDEDSDDMVPESSETNLETTEQSSDTPDIPVKSPLRDSPTNNEESSGSEIISGSAMSEVGTSLEAAPQNILKESNQIDVPASPKYADMAYNTRRIDDSELIDVSEDESMLEKEENTDAEDKLLLNNKICKIAQIKHAEFANNEIRTVKTLSFNHEVQINCDTEVEPRTNHTLSHFTETDTEVDSSRGILQESDTKTLAEITVQKAQMENDRDNELADFHDSPQSLIDDNSTIKNKISTADRESMENKVSPSVSAHNKAQKPPEIDDDELVDVSEDESILENEDLMHTKNTIEHDRKANEEKETASPMTKNTDNSTPANTSEISEFPIESEASHDPTDLESPVGCPVSPTTSLPNVDCADKNAQIEDQTDDSLGLLVSCVRSLRAPEKNEVCTDDNTYTNPDEDPSVENSPIGSDLPSSNVADFTLEKDERHRVKISDLQSNEKPVEESHFTSNSSSIQSDTETSKVTVLAECQNKNEDYLVNVVDSPIDAQLFDNSSNIHIKDNDDADVSEDECSPKESQQLNEANITEINTAKELSDMEYDDDKDVIAASTMSLDNKETENVISTVDVEASDAEVEEENLMADSEFEEGELIEASTQQSSPVVSSSVASTESVIQEEATAQNEIQPTVENAVAAYDIEEGELTEDHELAEEASISQDNSGQIDITDKSKSCDQELMASRSGTEGIKALDEYSVTSSTASHKEDNTLLEQHAIDNEYEEGELEDVAEEDIYEKQDMKEDEDDDDDEDRLYVDETYESPADMENFEKADDTVAGESSAKVINTVEDDETSKALHADVDDATVTLDENVHQSAVCDTDLHKTHEDHIQSTESLTKAGDEVTCTLSNSGDDESSSSLCREAENSPGEYTDHSEPTSGKHTFVDMTENEAGVRNETKTNEAASEDEEVCATTTDPKVVDEDLHPSPKPDTPSNLCIEEDNVQAAAKCPASPVPELPPNDTSMVKIADASDEHCAKPNSQSSKQHIEKPTQNSSSSDKPYKPSEPSITPLAEDSEETSRNEATLPTEISDFVLSVLDNKNEDSLGKMDDLESISSESLASPQSDVEDSIKMCIRSLESDCEDEVDETLENKDKLQAADTNLADVSHPELTTSHKTQLPTTFSLSSKSDNATKRTNVEEIEKGQVFTYTSQASSDKVLLQAPDCLVADKPKADELKTSDLAEIQNSTSDESVQSSLPCVNSDPKFTHKTLTEPEKYSSQQVDVKNSIEMCIQTLESDLEGDIASTELAVNEKDKLPSEKFEISACPTATSSNLPNTSCQPSLVIDHPDLLCNVPSTPTSITSPTRSLPVELIPTQNLQVTASAVERVLDEKKITKPITNKESSLEVRIPKLALVQHVLAPSKVACVDASKSKITEQTSVHAKTVFHLPKLPIVDARVQPPSKKIKTDVSNPLPFSLQSSSVKSNNPTRANGAIACASVPMLPPPPPPVTKKPRTSRTKTTVATAAARKQMEPILSPVPQRECQDGNNVSPGSTQQLDKSRATPTPYNNKRHREEDYETVPTRVQFLLPQNTPSVSSVEDVATPSLPVVSTSSQQSSTTPVAYDPSLLYLVQPDGQQAFDGNYQLVYAAAAATAERDEGVIDGPPNKVRLLYAEALGVGSDSQNGNELQFYYAATTPDQQVQQTSTPCHVQLMDPCRVTYSQATNEARSDVLQYQVHSNDEQEQNYQSQQQVLNLSVNPSNPVYYYNYSSTATVSQQGPPAPQPPPPPPPLPSLSGQQQQQNSVFVHDHGQYSSSTSTTKLVVANQNAYPEMEASSHHNYQNYSDRSSEVQDLSARRLELPVYTARSDHVAYAHVRSNDPAQYNYLEKAREVQHVFPQGALRHCDAGMGGYGSHHTSSAMSQNGLLPGYAQNGAKVLTNGGTGCSSVAGGSSSTFSDTSQMSGLDLLSAATERIKYMQYQALCTERAAAAIAAVGEIARLRRIESHQRKSSPPDEITLPEKIPPPMLPQENYRHQLPNITSQQPPSSFNHMMPQKPLGNAVGTPQEQLHNESFLANQHINNNYPQQNLSMYQGHPNHTNHPLSHDMPMGTNPADQQAGIRRGPRKYYLSRSAHFQD